MWVLFTRAKGGYLATSLLLLTWAETLAVLIIICSETHDDWSQDEGKGILK